MCGVMQDRLQEYVENIRDFAEKMKANSVKPVEVETDFDARRKQEFEAKEQVWPHAQK